MNGGHKMTYAQQQKLLLYLAKSILGVSVAIERRAVTKGICSHRWTEPESMNVHDYSPDYAIVVKCGECAITQWGPVFRYPDIEGPSCPITYVNTLVSK